MPFEPTFRVQPCEGGYQVVTKNERGDEYACTLATPDRRRAEEWCRTLQGAARVETERAKDERAKRPL